MQYRLQKFLLTGLLVILTSSVAACMPAMKQEAKQLDSSSSSVVIVGKVELDPPIDMTEQTTHWNMIGDDVILNRIFIASGAEPGSVNMDQPEMSEWHGAIETELGKTYFLEADRERTYLKGAMLMLDAMKQDRLWFPGGLVFDVPKEGEAIYLGTLRYSRNVFNEITRIEVIDEYQLALGEFRQRFGEHAELKRSLLKPY